MPQTFVVSGNRVHFGCRGYQSPSDEVSKQWEPQTAVSSYIGLTCEVELSKVVTYGTDLVCSGTCIVESPSGHQANLRRQ